MTDKKIIKELVEREFEKIRPHLLKDGGDVEYVDFDEEHGSLELRLLGACKDCPLSIMTLRAGIERIILKNVPQVKRVEAIKY